MTKVSVIIPVYNCEDYLERCLDSVINQSLEDIEIICINDGSTDNSAQILEEYKEFYKFKVITQKNNGLSVARNEGLKAATGEYVAFLDSDDFVDENFYKELYEQISKADADIACASIIRENDNKSSYLVKYENIETVSEIKEKFRLSGCPQYNFVWNKLYKKSFLEENNLKFIPGVIYEDMWFTPDVLEKANEIVSVPNTAYHYWKHKNTLIKCSNDKSRNDKIRGNEYLRKKCELHGVRSNNILYKEDVIVGGILFLRKKIYSATKKYYLFGIILFLETRKNV